MAEGERERGEMAERGERRDGREGEMEKERGERERGEREREGSSQARGTQYGERGREERWQRRVGKGEGDFSGVEREGLVAGEGKTEQRLKEERRMMRETE